MVFSILVNDPQCGCSLAWFQLLVAKSPGPRFFAAIPFFFTCHKTSTVLKKIVKYSFLINPYEEAKGNISR
jgi:hypothetical protein